MASAFPLEFGDPLPLSKPKKCKVFLFPTNYFGPNQQNQVRSACFISFINDTENVARVNDSEILCCSNKV